MSEKRVFKSVDVAVYGRLDTNNVDLQDISIARLMREEMARQTHEIQVFLPDL